MKRKDFLRKTLLSGIAGITTVSLLRATSNNSGNERTTTATHRVGYNHLPNQNDKTMNTVIHNANTRGYADHGWLQTRHTFSFANYHNPDRMNFGVLRVLNDDHVTNGKGFSTHPHKNMEIISIPLEGDLKHKDSMGNTAIIKEGDVQVMSAGTGVFHSEFNKNADKPVKFLQIWMFPNKTDVTPRYDQLSLSDLEKENDFYQILSPNQDDEGVWVHQNAWFHMGKFEKDKTATYTLKASENGLYVFILEGQIQIGEHTLNKRDGIGLWDTPEVNFKFTEKSKVLLMDIPMKLTKE